MTQKVQNTLRNFISSNNAFCDALRKDQIYLDNNIIFELIIYYLTLNKNILHMLPEQDRYYLNEIIHKQNFTIENDKILVGDTSLSIAYLREIVLEIEEKLKPSIKGKVMYLNDHSIKDFKVVTTHYQTSSRLKVIPFEASKKSTYYTLVNREVEYERTTRINSKTRPYIKESKDNFIALVNDIVHKALTSNLDDYSIKYLKVIASYIQLYPFTTYLTNKKTVPYEVLTIDHNKIGIRKTTHTEPELNRLKRELRNLLRYQQQLEYEQEQEAHDEHVKSH